MSVYRWLVLMLVLLGCGSARAELMPQTVVRSADAGTGITWVMVRLTNQTATPQGAELGFTSYGNSGGGNIRVPVAKIPPGASRVLNIPLMFATQTAYITGDDGRTRGLSLEMHNRYGGMEARVYALVSTPQNQLTDTQLDDFTRANTPSSAMHLGSGAMFHPAGVSSSGTTPTLLSSERIITQMEVDELPENWLCYVPLKILFLPQSLENQISAAQRNALDTWLELGGNLYIFDSDTSGSEKRGMGVIERLTNNPVADVHSFHHVHKPINQVISGMSGGGMPYAVEETGGRAFSLVLITLFVIAVGPVNYVYYARRGEIRKLLKTVPLVSVAFCGLIAVYFLVTEGFARKGGSISVTQLDETSNRAITFSQHFLMSGLYPSGGFHFDRNTYLRTLTGQKDETAGATLDKELVITRGLFRPKIPFKYMTILPHSTRERLLVSEDGRSARNGFELPVKAVAVYRNGQYFAGGGAASGGEVSLEPRQVKPAPVDPLMEDPALVGWLGAGAENQVLVNLVRQLDAAGVSREEMDFVLGQVRSLGDDAVTTSGTVYAAVFDGNPAGVQAGLEIAEGKNFHVVVGVAQGEGATE